MKSKSILAASVFAWSTATACGQTIYYTPSNQLGVPDSIVINGTNADDTIMTWGDSTQLMVCSVQSQFVHHVAQFNTSLGQVDLVVTVNAKKGNDVVTYNHDGVPDDKHPRFLIYGSEGSDSIGGGYNNDQIFGGPGRDFIFGFAGVDTLIGDNDEDHIWSGEGADVCNGWSSINVPDGADNFLDQGGAMDALRANFTDVVNPEE